MYNGRVIGSSLNMIYLCGTYIAIVELSSMYNFIIIGQIGGMSFLECLILLTSYNHLLLMIIEDIFY